MFRDDLQTELTHIKATNKIGTTASSPITSGQASYQSSGSRQGHHFFRRAPQFSRPTNYKLTNEGALQPKEELQTTSQSAEKTHHVIDNLQSLKVSQLTTFIPHLVDYFKSQASSFQAGRIVHCKDAWKSITADSEI